MKKTFLVLTILMFFFILLSVYNFPKTWLIEIRFLIGMFIGYIVYTVIKDSIKEEK